MKGDVDALVSVTNLRSAVTIIFQSDEENFSGASILVMEGITNSSCVETIACSEALCLARGIDLNSMVITSNCSPFIRNINEGSLGAHAMSIWETVFKMRLRGSDFKA